MKKQESKCTVDKKPDDCENCNENNEVLPENENCSSGKSADKTSVESALIEILNSQIQSVNEELNQTNQQLKKETMRADDMNTFAKRLQADFDNYKRRTNENNKKLREDGMVDVLEKVIPILDVIDQALKLITDEKVVEGVNMIARQIKDMLNSFNVTEICALDEEFDPNLHNAVARVENSEKSNKVVEVFRSGYRLGDRIIRHSVVAVAM